MSAIATLVRMEAPVTMRLILIPVSVNLVILVQTAKQVSFSYCKVNIRFMINEVVKEINPKQLKTCLRCCYFCTALCSRFFTISNF